MLWLQQASWLFLFLFPFFLLSSNFILCGFLQSLILLWEQAAGREQQASVVELLADREVEETDVE